MTRGLNVSHSSVQHGLRVFDLRMFCKYTKIIYWLTSSMENHGGMILTGKT
jgi:hypothetical protein